MRVLITGGSGMVGRNLVDHSGSRKHEVRAPTRQTVDLRSYQAIRSYLSEFRPEVVIHCAAKVGGIQANIDSPVDFLVENWDMGRNLFLACADANVARVVNLGSSCMYPRDWEASLDESLILAGPLEPTNEGYALAKISVARLGSYIGRQHPALRYRTVLPCNLYGRYDHFEPRTSHLLAAALTKAHAARVGGANRVEVWGDGKARREFMYAGDLAEFLWIAVDRFDDLPEVLNVGPGVDHTIDEYYSAALAAVGHSAELEHDPSRAVGMRQKLMSTKRLSAFGWRPSTDLKHGLKLTYEYFLEKHA
jgi:GDP-L-fucose synthase